jgi:hypothetical protein
VFDETSAVDDDVSAWLWIRHVGIMTRLWRSQHVAPYAGYVRPRPSGEMMFQMDTKTFRGQWRIVGGRAVSWTFGRIDVGDGAITARSIGWSWWVKDQEIAMRSIDSIKTSYYLQVATFVIHHDEGKRLEFYIRGTDADQMIRELERRGYVIDNPMTL